MKQNYIKILLIIIVITMTIAYASINTTLNINGKVSIESKKGIIFLNALPLVSSEETDNSVINKIEGTTTDFKIILKQQNDSSASYKIRLFNNSNSYYRLKNIIENKDNNNIEYTISGLNKEKIISPNEEYDFYINFHYNEQNDYNNQTLNSIMVYEFEEISEEIIFADKVSTTKYSLSIINQMFQRIHELYNMLENSQYYDTGGTKEEMMLLFKEINWILNNTIIYNANLLNGTYTSTININDREFLLDLTNIINNILIDENIFDDMYTLKMNMILLDNSTYEKLNHVNTLKNELESNSIIGTNLINVTQEANDTIAYIQVRESAVAEIQDILFRIQELTLRKENLEESNVNLINSEIENLILDLYRILDETIFNNTAAFELNTFKVNNKNIEFSAMPKEDFKDLEDNYTTMNPAEFNNIIKSKIEKVNKERIFLGNHQNMLEYYLININ